MIGLVSLFHGISTFVCYLMRKPFLMNNSSTIQPIAGGIKRVRIFSKGISSKVDVIA